VSPPLICAKVERAATIPAAVNQINNGFLAHPGRLAERGTLTATRRRPRRPDLPEGERRNKSQSLRPSRWCKFDPLPAAPRSLLTDAASQRVA